MKHRRTFDMEFRCQIDGESTMCSLGNDSQPLTVDTKNFILDAADVLDTPVSRSASVKIELSIIID